MIKMHKWFVGKRINLVKKVVINILLYLLALVPTIIFIKSSFANSGGGVSVSNIKDTKGYAEHYKYDYSKKYEVSIGSRSQTRISFYPYTIKEIVGDSNKYKIISSNNGSFVFLAPKAKQAEKIDITVIASNGKAQDLLLTVNEGYGKSIIIEDKSCNQSSQQRVLDEAKLMLKSMIRGYKSKYDHTKFQDKNLLFKGTSPDIEISKTEVYRYNLYNLIGLVVDIKNKSGHPIECREINLKNLFQNLLLISFDPKNKISFIEQLSASASYDNFLETKYVIDKGSNLKAYIVLQDHLSREE